MNRLLLALLLLLLYVAPALAATDPPQCAVVVANCTTTGTTTLTTTGNFNTSGILVGNLIATGGTLGIAGGSVVLTIAANGLTLTMTAAAGTGSGSATFTGFPACQPYQQFRSPDRLKHVAIIRPSRWDALNASNVTSLRQNLVVNIGDLADVMEMNGLEVHYYDTSFFESDPDHREMWTNLGAKYALALVLYPESDAASFARYVCADSTNTQIVVFGGADAGAAQGWAAGDTTIRGFADSKQSSYEAIPANNGACLVSTDDRDTVWAIRLPSGRRIATLPANISSVVRLLRPATTSGTAWIADADSGNTKMPGSARTGWLGGLSNPSADFAAALAADARDSTASAMEYLGPLWKVVFANYSGQGVATWINSLGTGPKEVYWFKQNSQVSPVRAMPQFAWALVCRFTTARPIRWGYDWDDVTDKFFDNNGSPPRWRASALDSALAGLAAFGIRPTAMVNPGHITAYVHSGDPSYESAWSGGRMGGLKGLDWVHHSHDSTTGSITSNLVGGYGGYGTGNGANTTQGGNVIQNWQHRYASRWNPGANEAGFIGAGGNFGIVQRLAYMDSVRRALGHPAMPPYLAEPANEFLPIGWRARPTTTNPLWTLYFSAGAECPIDSTLWAYDLSLNGGAGTERRKLFLRTATDNPREQTPASNSFGSTLSADRDSANASSPFAYPNEKFTVPVNGRLVQAVGVNSFLQGVGTRAGDIANANFRTAVVLGLKNPVYCSDNQNSVVSEAFNTDINGVYVTGGSSLNTAHDFGGRMATHIVYQHPGQHGATFTANGDMHVDTFIRYIATQLRTMDTIAGRRTQRCVPAWQVYDSR